MKELICYTRRKCEADGCDRLSRNKGKYKEKTRYGRFCVFHHKKTDIFLSERKGIENKKCEMCGWDKAYCDRHRIEPKLGYTKENVKVLCPNCHRLVTIGLLNCN